MEPNDITPPTPQPPKVPQPESLETPAVAVNSAPVSPVISPTNSTQPTQPVVESTLPTPSPTTASTITQPPKPKLGKKQLLFILAIALLILGVGGFIFGYYLPNQPDYVWSSGVTNSGKAITAVVNDLTTTERMELLKKTEVTITADVNGEGYKFTGNLNSKLDTNKSSSNAKIASEMNASGKMSLAIDMLTEVAADKIYPDMYFKVAGLKTLGELSYANEFLKYDDKWIAVRSDYLEGFYRSLDSKPKEKQEQINSGDTAEFVKTLSKISDDYLFSSKKIKPC